MYINFICKYYANNLFFDEVKRKRNITQLTLHMFNCNIYSVSWNIKHAVIVLKIHPQKDIIHMHIYYIYAYIMLKIVL